MIWSGKLLLDDFLAFLKMNLTFIKDHLHRIESRIWSHHILQASCYYSDYKLNFIDGSVRKIPSASGTLEILVDIFTINQLCNPSWYL